MKFFIPHAKDSKQAEEVLESIVKFAEKTTGWQVSKRRIFYISYTHNGKNLFAEVGKPDPETREEVIAILESNAYLVCTLNRGVKQDMPLLVGKESTHQVIDFD